MTKEAKKLYIAHAIINALERKGMKRKEFAELMAIKPPQVTRMLTGRQNLTIETIFKAEEVLGITIITL